MASGGHNISPSSRRIARNTIALYFRMFVLLFVGLFTARIVLNALGVSDRGVYEAVGSFVSMMSIITSSLSTAISRFLTVEIGRGDIEKQKKVFATANAIMLSISVIVLLIAEPLGIWYVGNVMNLPPGRETAAQWVFQSSLCTFVVNLMAAPYNAAIVAHEKMGAFAIIGIVEGICKLLVALALKFSSGDKLILYGLLMFFVALLVRSLYATYSRRHFEESRAGYSWDKEYFGKMFSFAGWNGLSYGIYLVNTQGITLLINYFFGVVFNTMRGISLNVESMVKQFVINVVMAVNPQITKSYASGDRQYAYDLTCKGVKYAFLIILTLSLPFFFEAEMILRLWLGKIVPDGTALFVRLTLVCLILDITMNTFSALIQADGHIKRFYLIMSSVTAIIFPATWILYLCGASVYSFYYVFIAVYIILDILKVLIVSVQTGIPKGMFLRDVVLKVLPVTLISLAATLAVWVFLDSGWLRLILVLCVGTLSVAVSTYFFALSKGERAFVNSKIPFKKRSLID